MKLQIWNGGGGGGGGVGEGALPLDPPLFQCLYVISSTMEYLSRLGPFQTSCYCYL